jgi:prepilin-type N-terminal cleavage/methylation domain-containing protein
MNLPARLFDEELGAESGFSLIEVLLAVVIMGTAFVSILAAMGTAAQSAGLHRTEATAELEVRRYAELVEAAPWDASCAYTPKSVGYVPTTTPDPAPYPVSGPLGAPPFSLVVTQNPLPCTAGSGVQTVHVEIQSANGKVREFVDLVKRAP